LDLDVERAEGQTGSDEFKAYTSQCRQWLDEHKEGEAKLFYDKGQEALREFKRMNESAWADAPARDYYEWKARIQKT
jgi:hypothetical protein